MAATVGQLVVNLKANSAQFTRDIQTAQQKIKKFTKETLTLGNALKVVGAAYATKKIFDFGAAVEETASKFSTVFGEATGEVQDFVDEFASLAGLSQTNAKEVLATTGAIVQGMGLATDASAAFAIEIVKLSGDLSSFNNIPIEETTLAIQSALTGERESLKRLGIVILETDVQKRALAMTGKAAASALNQEEKAMATLALITERAGVAMGDLERTQLSSANQARFLTAELKNTAEAAAAALTPAFQVLIDRMVEMNAEAKELEGSFREIGESVAVFVQTIITGLSTVTNSVELIIDGAVKTIVDVLAFATGAWNAFATSINNNLPDWASAWKIVDARDAYVTLLGMSDQFATDMSADIDDIKKTWADLWEVMLRDAASTGAAVRDGLNAGDNPLAPPPGTAAEVKTLLDLWMQFPAAMLEIERRADQTARMAAGWERLNAGVELSTESMRAFGQSAVENLTTAQVAAQQLAATFLDRLVDSLARGKASIKDWADFFVTELRRVIAKMLILRSLEGMAGDNKTGFWADLAGSFAASSGFLGGTRAGGGPVSPSSAYLVGEKGPEMFVPKTAGNIVPNGGGMTVHQNINFNVQALDAPSVAALLESQGGTIASIVGNAARESVGFRSALQGA